MPTVSETATDQAQPPPRIAVERHRRGNRWMHWINFPLLTVMIWSGLRIYWADLRDPFVLGIGGWEIFEFFPDSINEDLGLNRKLARGMAFHFTFGWLFLINGTAFGLYIWRTGGWRNFLPTRDDLRQIPGVLLHEAGIKKDAPPQGKYNAVQQLTYGAVLAMGALAIISGFAIYKPTQLSLLTSLMGGYDSARFIHFAVTIAFMLFFVVHIAQVARSGVAGFFSMVTGYELLPSDTVHRSATAERRLSARLRDLVSILGIAAAIVLIPAAIDSGENPNWLRNIGLVAVAVGFLWDLLWVGARGATPGKQVYDLQVVRTGTDGNKPSFVHALTRSLGWVIVGVAVALLARGGNAWLVIIAMLVLVAAGSVQLFKAKNRRTLIDMISGTDVVAGAAIGTGSAPEVAVAETEGALQ